MHRRLSSLSRHERPLSLFLHCKKQHSIRAQSARIPSEYSRVFLDFISFLNNTRSTIKEKVAKIDLEIFFTRWLPFPLRNLLPATRCIPSDSILVIAGGVTRTISHLFPSLHCWGSLRAKISILIRSKRKMEELRLLLMNHFYITFLTIRYTFYDTFLWNIFIQTLTRILRR